MRIKNMIFCLAIFLTSLCIGCAKSDNAEQVQETDYKPMIFVNGTLYGDTGKSVNALPDNWEHIGDIENVVSQSAPMVKEEFTSNTLTIGDEIYGSNTETKRIYVKVSTDKLLLYEVMEE